MDKLGIDDKIMIACFRYARDYCRSKDSCATCSVHTVCRQLNTQLFDTIIFEEEQEDELY